MGKARTGAAVGDKFRDSNVCAHCYVNSNLLPVSVRRVNGKATSLPLNKFLSEDLTKGAILTPL